MRFLITGYGGQLACEFARTLKEAGHEYTALDIAGLDISDESSVICALSRFTPEVVLNCAAYNLVDNAENDPDAALRTNCTGVGNLASACGRNNVLLVHYGTDYVFDGTKEGLYTEEDCPNPINNYGRSKLSGEKLVTENTDNFLIFRTSWVFGEGKQNFFYKLRQWAGKNMVLKVVCDQISVPTCTEDIARLTLLAVNKGLRGLYHLTNSGYASRYETARYFLEGLGMDTLVLPVTSDLFPTPAARPYFSAMSNTRLAGELCVEIPHWKNGMDRYIGKKFYDL